MSNLFEAAGLAETAPRPLADRLRPTQLSRGRRAGPSARAGRHADAHAARRAASARSSSGGRPAPARPRWRGCLPRRPTCTSSRSPPIHLRRRRAEEDLRRGARPPPGGAGDAALRRRDPPLQPRAAGFLPAGHGGRHRHAGRRDDRESVLRAERGAALARHRARLQAARRRRRSRSCSTRAEAAEGRPLPLDDEARAVADPHGRRRRPRRAVARRGGLAGGRRRTRCSAQERLQEILQRRAPIYDKSQDGHYNLISALHKSVRGSDPQAALYYLCRMLDGGEDPMYLARRLIRMAVGGYRPRRPQCARRRNAARDAYHMLGTPEGELALAEAAVYLATAPKSNALYTAFGAAMRAAKEGGSLLPPKHILNAPTKLMKSEGYGTRLRIRPRRAGSLLRPGLFSRRPGAAGVLPADRARLREAHRRAHGGVGAAEERTAAIAERPAAAHTGHGIEPRRRCG